MKTFVLALLVALLSVVGVACDTVATKVADKIPTAPTITVPAVPVIVKFDADATRLGPPNGATLDTTLRWDVTGDGVRCRIDQLPGQPIGNVPNTGSQSVRPGVTTMYTLTCTNAAGTVLRNVTILVG